MNLRIKGNMNTTMNTSENLFRLLVPVTELTLPDTPFVELCGSRWILTEFASISDAPPYTCISYSWGVDRTKNPFKDDLPISTRTIPALEATIKASQSPEHWENAVMSASRDAQEEQAMRLEEALKASQAIWIDALCVPSRDPVRAACLRSMGAIYSSATQVFAVLSEPCSKLLHQIHNTGHMEPDELFVLENDDWITRAWTYQEMANSKSTLFIAQGDGSVLILGLDFLNAILTDTTDYADAQGFERTKLAVRFPRLDSLQEMMSEHRLVEFAGRSVYQVMSAMHQRIAERELDRIYAMIGVITIQPSNSLDGASLHPAEYFMRLCEAKGDYSFIYCIAPRSDIPGRAWRPVSDQLFPVLPGLLASGTGLSGCIKATHLQMDNMCRMNPSRINSVASSIGNFLHDNIAVAILERLRQKGFTGCGEYLELENGYFFPQSSFTRSKDIFVVTSQDVLWTHGGPGILLRSNGTDINQFCDVGVFIGRFPKENESINIG